MTERRRWKRYPIAYPIERAEEDANHKLTVRDVSKGGVAFTSTGKMDENDKFNVRIFLKNRMFKLKAIVVHAKELKENLYNVGAKFVNAPQEFHALLEREIEEIKQFHRECNLYNRKNFSLEEASIEYLENVSTE
jgi:hypothetical protein